jgi:hypothetical protein
MVHKGEIASKGGQKDIDKRYRNILATYPGKRDERIAQKNYAAYPQQI